MIIQYAYGYEEEFDLWTIRRLDGECLDYHVPDGLLKNIYYSGDHGDVDINDIKRYVHYDTECVNAIVDFKRLDYEPRDIDFIIKDIEDAQVLKLI